MDTCVGCGSEANFICDCSLLICEKHMGTHLKLGDKHSVRSFRGNIIKKNALSKIRSQLKILDQCSHRVIQDLNAFIQEANNFARESLKHIQEIRLQLLNQLQLIRKMMSPEELNKLQSISEKVSMGQSHSFIAIKGKKLEAIVEATVDKEMWKCKCSKVNLKYSKYCMSCYEPKEEAKDKKPEVPKEEVKHQKPEVAKKLEMDNEWACKKCRKVNSSISTYCPSCYEDKPTEPKPTLPISKQVNDDWICKSCKGQNYSLANYCSNCFTPKKEPEPEKKTSWTCLKCQSPNTLSAKTCYYCYTPSPDSKTPASRQGLTSASGVSKRSISAEPEKNRPVICSACGKECKIVDCPTCTRTQKFGENCSGCKRPLKNITECSSCNTSSPVKRTSAAPRKICKSCGKENRISATKCLECYRTLR